MLGCHPGCEMKVMTGRLGRTILTALQALHTPCQHSLHPEGSRQWSPASISFQGDHMAH